MGEIIIPQGYKSALNLHDTQVAIKTLKDYVQRLYNFPSGVMATDYEPEDWAGLERYLKTSGSLWHFGVGAQRW